MVQEIKCVIERRPAIDYSPIYTIILKEDVNLKAGDGLKFDPAVGILEVIKPNEN